MSVRALCAMSGDMSGLTRGVCGGGNCGASGGSSQKGCIVGESLRGK